MMSRQLCFDTMHLVGCFLCLVSCFVNVQSCHDGNFAKSEFKEVLSVSGIDGTAGMNISFDEVRIEDKHLGTRFRPLISRIGYLVSAAELQDCFGQLRAVNCFAL